MARACELPHLRLDALGNDDFHITACIDRVTVGIPAGNQQDRVQYGRDHPVGHEIGLGGDLTQVVDAARR